jgi:hypothetical protein
MTMGASPGRRLALAVLAMWAPFLAYGVLAGDARLVRFFPDDAFYYLQPASAMAQTGRATFDGIHLTNAGGDRAAGAVMEVLFRWVRLGH